MADDVTVTPGTGKTVRAVDIGGKQYQVILIGGPTDGAAVDLQALVGALTETAPASDTASSGLNGRLQRIAQRLTSMIALLPAALGQGTKAQGLRVVLPSDQDPLQVGGSIVTLVGTFTRPANTTAYTANDVVSNSTSATTLIVITNAARVVGGSGYIVGARLTTDLKSITPRVRLHVYNASTPTIAVDNAAMQLRYTDSSKRIRSVDMPALSTPIDATNSTQSEASLPDPTNGNPPRIPFICASGDRNLYILLETLDAFTPASGQGFTLTVDIDQN